jgi:hypothetical protein
MAAVPPAAPAPTATAAGCVKRLPSATNGRANPSANRRDNSVRANAAKRINAKTRPYWLTRTAHAPPTAASVAMAANVPAMPTSSGRPSVRKRRSERANTNGSTGRMHGLNMVSTPAK